MATLVIKDLTEPERQAIESAMRMLDPYLSIAKVDWTSNIKETE